MGRNDWLGVVLGGCLMLGTAVAQEKGTGGARLLPDDPESAWTEVVKAGRPPAPPAAWNTKRPSDEEYQAFRREMAEAAGKAADKAAEFAVRWPSHAKASDARREQVRLLTAATQLGAKSREAELAALKGGEAAPAADGAARAGAPAAAVAGDGAVREKFLERLRGSIDKARALSDKGLPAMLAEYHKELLVLRKEFGDQEEILQGFYEVASMGEDPAVSRELVGVILAAPSAPEKLKGFAAKLQESLSRVGKPVEIQFTATDGSAVDLSKMKGKVVLIDFWATWCGPCVQEVPNVRAAYERLNPKGFEIVGISFDQEKEALLAFTKKQKMPWAQYFDGEGWGNKFGQKFGISGIPSMWLIDKKGNLRDLQARDRLAEKVEKLLAEN